VRPLPRRNKPILALDDVEQHGARARAATSTPSTESPSISEAGMAWWSGGPGSLLVGGGTSPLPESIPTQ